MNLLGAALLVWRLGDGQVVPEEGADTARSVGSLQKAWVAKAWGLAHSDPATPPPRTTCDASSRCWLAPGHGSLDLRGATARSCNAYFRSLAAETPEAVLRQTFAAAGFEVSEHLTPDAAIGLEANVAIAPRRLLQAYAELLTTAWAVRDEVRREWLDGMRDAGEGGTAAGVPLRGFLAKTGTVHALDGAPLGTSGWALLFDPTGRSGHLALLPRGTGSQAAAALGALLKKENAGGRAEKEPGKSTEARFSSSGIEREERRNVSGDSDVPHSAHSSSSERELAQGPRQILAAGASRSSQPSYPSKKNTLAADSQQPVSVRLFVSLRPTEISAKNIGSAPVRVDTPNGGDWIGPGSEVPLEPGFCLGFGTWRLTVPRFGLVRIVRGSLHARGSPETLTADTTPYSPSRKSPVLSGAHVSPVSLVLTATRRDYVEGVIRGELQSAPHARQEELGAAILRFLARGARHGAEDVCDLTHCARFAGLGPDVTWTSPETALVDTRGAIAPPPAFLDDAGWRRASGASALPGPAHFTGHCGSAPLSEKAVWGSGSETPHVCPRHSGEDASSRWTRRWPSSSIDAAFGDRVDGLEAVEVEGVRMTLAAISSSSSTSKKKSLLYDDLHRRIATTLGWDALPSPPEAYERVNGGWQVTGRGSGHRVGLCMGD